jgi:hypothetical protein
MVKKGRFIVELVNADIKTVFKEHTKDNETYVEAEPDAEYFVRIFAIGIGSPVQAKIFVDDKYLGYDLHLTTQHKTDNYGLWNFDGVSTTYKKLSFLQKRRFSTLQTPPRKPLFGLATSRSSFQRFLIPGQLILWDPLRINGKEETLV